MRSGKIFCDYYWWKSGWAAYTFRNDNTITDVWIGTMLVTILCSYFSTFPGMTLSFYEYPWI